ncbi:MAG: hypothetical protein AB7P04_02405 [Bacteriovoracia bacterium]
MFSWLNPTGGALYHLRAWRYRETLWREFRETLAACLTQWHPPASRLLLIGPSAGYCLDENLLRRFEQIDAIEPDPLAGWFLRRRFARVRPIRIHRTSFFEGPAHAYRTRLADFPEHAVLFCNVLGQLKFSPEFWENDAAFAGFRKALARDLSARHWASFHDLLSGPSPKRVPPPWELERAQSNPEIARRLYTNLEPAPRTPSVELVDHFMEGFFPDRPRTILHWPLKPGTSHWIEFIQS